MFASKAAPGLFPELQGWFRNDLTIATYQNEILEEGREIMVVEYLAMKIWFEKTLRREEFLLSVGEIEDSQRRMVRPLRCDGERE